MTDSETISACFVGYSIKPLRDQWLKKTDALRSTLEATTLSSFTHFHYVQKDDIESALPHIAIRAFEDSSSSSEFKRLIDCNLLEFVAFFQSVTKRVTTDRVVTCIQAHSTTYLYNTVGYSLLYVHIPGPLLHAPGNLAFWIKLIFKNFQNIGIVDYGLATTMANRLMPSEYFLDHKERSTKSPLQINQNVWLGQKHQLQQRVRGIYDANIISAGHILKFGGLDRLIRLLDASDLGYVFHSIPPALFAIYSPEDRQKSYLASLFKEHDVLMAGMPNTTTM